MVNDYTRLKTNKVPEITDDYQIGGHIRRGYTGEIRKCINKKTRQLRAVKIFLRSKLKN